MNADQQYPTLENLRANALNGFLLPDGYFEKSEKDIKTQIFLNTVSSFENGFSLPQNYFLNLKTEVETKIILINEKQNIDVPPNYFENLSKTIFDKIEAEEKKETPLLNSLNKNTGFKIPEGYFERLSSEVNKKINEPKVISINRNNRGYTLEFLKWAAVAVVVLSSGWFIYNSLNNKTVNLKTEYADLQLNESFEKIALQELDEETILEYIGAEQASNGDTKELKDNISEEEILQNIDINDLGDAL